MVEVGKKNVVGPSFAIHLATHLSPTKVVNKPCSFTDDEQL